MASLFGKLAGIARSPHGQKMISQASRKAQDLAKDPATRAKIDKGTARVRAEVDKRRGGSAPTPPARPASTTPVTPPVTPAVTPPTTPPATPPPSATP